MALHQKEEASLPESSVSISYEAAEAAGPAIECPIPGDGESFSSSGLPLLFIIRADVKLMWCRLLYYARTSCSATDAEVVFYRDIK